ncbi:MAG: lipoyl synthase [Chloroflexi bacterium]|nr:lipoyl synthase [Chloroflexota bacterium]
METTNIGKAPVRRFPPWIKARAPGGQTYLRLKGMMRLSTLHTVCEEAHCPNIGECWENGTATFMILGDICTRNCRYCAVRSGRPEGLDLEEPIRVAEAVKRLGLKHAVITSVNRDDLADGGASIFAETIRKSRELLPSCRVEVLIPDFQGSWEALATVMNAFPHILNHNIETVPRLYRLARAKATYSRSLELLRRAKEMNRAKVLTKSGLMVGLGEEWEEVIQVMKDLRENECDILTVGQYLSPSPKHLPVARFYTPEEFAKLKEKGLEMGFRHVESGPLVRSSYHAHKQSLNVVV